MFLLILVVCIKFCIDADCYVTVGEIELSYKMLNFYHPMRKQKVL